MATNNQNAAVPVFMGKFRHALDGKNRLTIPSQWRFEEEAELFLLPSSMSPCLTVMTRREIDRIRARVADRPGPERAQALRRIGSLGYQVWLDKGGRLSLPDSVCRDLKLSGEVTLNGALDTFEIWNTEAWDEAHASNKADFVLADLGI